MLADSKLPIIFWSEAVNTACHVLNRVLTVKSLNKTSYEVLNNRAPNLMGFEPFGVPCTILKTQHQPKFNGKADEGYFLGYMPNSPNKRVFNKNSGKIEVVFSIDVTSYSFEPQSGPDWLYDYENPFQSFNIPVSEDDEKLAKEI